MGGLGKSVGMCSSRHGRFRDVAGFGDLAWFGDLGLWLGNGVLKDVMLNGSDVPSDPAIPLALGLYIVTGHSVDDSYRDVAIFCWGQEQYLLARV